ncbi:MAG: hypothetical protein ACXWLH_00765 [Candidatus Saccharimonadales bacterium]
MERNPMQESFMVPETTAVLKGRLAIGVNAEGRIKSSLETEQQMAQFGALLAEHKRPITHPYTADCMDDRTTLRLADGTNDVLTLRNRITYQLPGGLGLAVTKAGVAANAPIIRDAKTFKDAYEIFSNLLTRLGYEDGGHAGCGASKFVEDSVANTVERGILLPTIKAVRAVNEHQTEIFDRIQRNKARRLESGFYSGWDPGWHEDYLSQKFPQNFSYLQTADDPAHGHRANGIYFIEENGMGFAKNAFHAHTGQMAFGVTTNILTELVRKLSPADKLGQETLLLAFPDDVVNVSDKLVALDMPAFADAA